MDGQRHVVVPDRVGLAGVDSNADLDVGAGRPIVGCEGTLSFDAGSDCGRRIWERNEQRITFGTDLDAAMTAEGGPQQ
jgi:hypothetical protein